MNKTGTANDLRGRFSVSGSLSLLDLQVQTGRQTLLYSSRIYTIQIKPNIKVASAHTQRRSPFCCDTPRFHKQNYESNHKNYENCQGENASASQTEPMRGEHTQQRTTSPRPVGSGGCLLHKVMYIIIHKVAYIVGITITLSVGVVVVLSKLQPQTQGNRWPCGR